MLDWRPLKKVLIANRGEIAVRLARSLTDMGIAPVAIFSHADRGAMHVRRAKEAYFVGNSPATESYLNIDRVLGVAESANCDAVHPGYGFLSENPEFAGECARRGLTFIGPSAAAMQVMAAKTNARRSMQAAGVPVIPGGAAFDLEEAKASAAQIGYPVMLKAVAGGGGKGMRKLSSASELEAQWPSAKGEAKRAFLDDTMYLEKYFEGARHVEVQILGDQHGKALSLFERDCSIQRRHQKVIEESPCPVITSETLLSMGKASVRGAQAISYHSAGTFEFLLDAHGDFFFLEMNTRLQVEHGVTELCTGIDLVEQMVRIARGEALDIPEPVQRRGHAIELRLYAEDPKRDFAPSPGRITHLSLPSGPGVRNDAGVEAGDEISPFYDPLISKLLVWGSDRAQCLARVRRALGECVIEGLATNIDFLQQMLHDSAFERGHYDTSYVDTRRDANHAEQAAPDELARVAAAAAIALHEGEPRDERHADTFDANAWVRASHRRSNWR